MMREALTSTLFSPTALARSSGPTISMAKLCRAGLSKTLMNPSTTARVHTIHNWTAPVATTRHSASACTRKRVWVTINTWRLSRRSAITPP